MNKVKTKLENQEYEQMIRKIPGGKAGDESSGLAYDISELRKVSSQMMSLVNILFSMVAVFAALFVFSEHVWNDPGLRVLFGLFGALVVGFAEGWFFSRDWLIDPPDVAPKKSQHARHIIEPSESISKSQGKEEKD
ncbi:hypothetical protein BSLG_010173 [Batrachochytrium salamandrivorans]|nr:hypothetical protein BSLG_010173 [Batrachochytrium salamandrivorans]